MYEKFETEEHPPPVVLQSFITTARVDDQEKGSCVYRYSDFGYCCLRQVDIMPSSFFTPALVHPVIQKKKRGKSLFLFTE